ncbi:unannotated protein [freshwater metagenome]|uniref:Unannotated protein n=1 Tax=freshwater metagenome TaxID=449393 RepID=A0A6J5YKY6_9ZZZZ|nr:hypothetical protein [Actinomycetota bacterium]
MSKRLAVYAFLVAIFLSIFPSVSSASNHDELSDTGNRAFEDLTRCISTKKVLDVYYLIDQSGSLKLTDKNDDRAGILAGSLSALGDFESDVTVNYAVTFFGDGVDNWAKWSEVNPSTIDSKANALSAEIKKPSRKSDFNTDWLAGLERARSDLEGQKRISNGCQALIWLTDGGIWLQNGSGYSAPHNFSQDRTDNAVNELCNDVMPALRQNQVSVFGVLLKNDAQLDQMDSTKREETVNGMSHMFPLVEGSLDNASIDGIPQDNRTCGVVPIPANQSAGAVLIATDPVSLALQFMVLTAATQGGNEGALSPGNPTRFTIDKGVRKFQLVSTTREWTLIGPSGESYSEGSAGVDVRRAGLITTIKVEVGALEFGKWEFAFDKNSRNKLFLFSGLDVRINRSGFVAGENGTLSGNIITSSKIQKVDLSAYNQAPVTIKIIKSDGKPESLAEVTPTNGGRFTLDNFRPLPGETQLELRLTMPLTTTGGTVLKPISVTVVIDIPDRSNYPTLEQVPVKIGDLVELKSGQGEIKIIGPSQGSGRVCFETGNNNGVETTSDELKDDRRFTYTIKDLPADGCVAVGENEPKSLIIEATTTKTGEGSVEANLPMTSYSDSDNNAFIKDDVPVEFNTTVEKKLEWLIKILLYLLGIALPWAFSYIQNRITTKIAFGPKIQRATLPVLIHSTKGVTAPDGSPMLVKGEDFRFIPEQSDTNFYKDPIGEMRAKTSINVLRAPWFEVAATPGHRLVTMVPSTSMLRKRFATGQVAPMKGNIDTFWAIQIKDGDLLNTAYATAIPGTLLIFKRNKLSQPNQHVDVVMKAVQTPGIWGAISALPKSVTAIVSGEKPQKKGVTPPPPPPISGTIPPPPPPPSGMVPPPPKF